MTYAARSLHLNSATFSEDNVAILERSAHPEPARHPVRRMADKLGTLFARSASR